MSGAARVPEELHPQLVAFDLEWVCLFAWTLVKIADQDLLLKLHSVGSMDWYSCHWSVQTSFPASVDNPKPIIRSVKEKRKGDQRGPWQVKTLHLEANYMCWHVFGRYGERISFYNDVPEILHGLRSRSLPVEGEAGGETRRVTIAACSRTHAPDL